jgi:hypothetical protein
MILTQNKNELIEIIVRVRAHYDSCLVVINKRFNENVARSALKFAKVEKSMLSKLEVFFDNDESIKEASDKQKVNFKTYPEMYENNIRLIEFLKLKIKEIKHEEVCTLLSYWVAALQMENDDMKKYLP